MMRSDSEIRESAWRLLWRGKWFWKLLAGTVLLNVCAQFVYLVLNGMLYSVGVFGMTALTNALEEYARNRTPLPDMTPGLVAQFASSTALTLFFGFIMAGIASYGISTLLLRAADEKNEGWLKAAFGGFAIPLDLAWLRFRMSLIFVFWSVVALVPSGAVFWMADKVKVAPPISTYWLVLVLFVALSLYLAIMCIPFYRYRYLFRIKADHPDWTAGRCIGECAALSEGFKWRSFVHDCSYWKILLAPLLLLVCVVGVCLAAILAVSQLSPEALMVVAAACVLVLVVSCQVCLVFFVIIGFYIGVGQTLLYRDVLQEKGKPAMTTEMASNGMP